MNTRMPTLAAALALTAAPALADNTATIDLTGVRLQNNLNQSRTSGTDTIDPGTRYHYSIDAMVRGSGGVLGTLYPNPTPLATVLEQLQPGSSAGLMGDVCNPGGQHPFTPVNQQFNGSTVLLGVTVTFAATLNATIGADHVASFSLTNVVLTPSFLVGSLLFTSGDVTLTGLDPCPVDFNTDCTVTVADFLAFLGAYAAGSPTADFNADGVVNVQDFLVFVGAYSAGCP